MILLKTRTVGARQPLSMIVSRMRIESRREYFLLGQLSIHVWAKKQKICKQVGPQGPEEKKNTPFFNFEYKLKNFRFRVQAHENNPFFQNREHAKKKRPLFTRNLERSCVHGSQYRVTTPGSLTHFTPFSRSRSRWYANISRQFFFFFCLSDSQRFVMNEGYPYYMCMQNLGKNVEVGKKSVGVHPPPPIGCIYVCRFNLRPKNMYVSEIKYQKYQQNIEGNSTLECENAKNSKLVRSTLARIFMDFS